EEVAKLKICLRGPGEVIALLKAATADAAGDDALASVEPVANATVGPALTMIRGGFRREPNELGATLGAADLSTNEKGPESNDLGPLTVERETGLEPDPGLIDQTETRRWLAPFSSVIQPA